MLVRWIIRYGVIGSDCPDIFTNMSALFVQGILYPLQALPDKGFHCPPHGCACQGIIGEFIGICIQSEVFARKLQHYYRTDTRNKGKDELRIDVLSKALEHFNIFHSEDGLSDLFAGGKGYRGRKTARQLRNGYLHSLSPEDRKEILSKATMFIPKLRAFIRHEI